MGDGLETHLTDLRAPPTDTPNSTTARRWPVKIEHTGYSGRDCTSVHIETFPLACGHLHPPPSCSSANATRPSDIPHPGLTAVFGPYTGQSSGVYTERSKRRRGDCKVGVEKISKMDERSEQGWSGQDQREQGGDHNPGVSLIQDSIDARFDANHPSVQTHAPFLTISQEETKAAKKAAREEPKGKSLEVEELWKPSGPGATFWEAAGVE